MRTRVAAAYVALVLSALYGAMKLSWARGGDVLMRQTPLPPQARADLLAGTPGMVAGHWASFGLALIGVTAALYLAGRFTARGAFQRRLLLVGSSTVGVLMVLRALAGGYADVARLTRPGGSRLDRELSRWDLFLWSPAWLVFGVSLAVATALWWRAPRHPAVGPVSSAR